MTTLAIWEPRRKPLPAVAPVITDYGPYGPVALVPLAPSSPAEAVCGPGHVRVVAVSQMRCRKRPVIPVVAAMTPHGPNGPSVIRHVGPVTSYESLRTAIKRWSRRSGNFAPMLSLSLIHI